MGERVGQPRGLQLRTDPSEWRWNSRRRTEILTDALKIVVAQLGHATELAAHVTSHAVERDQLLADRQLGR